MNRSFARTIPLVFVCLCVGRILSASPDVEYARQHGARAMLTFRVSDSTNQPIENATMSVAFYPTDSYADVVVSAGRTDSNGLFQAEGNTVGDVTYTITKEGYYKTVGKYLFYRQGQDCVRDGCWQPRNPVHMVMVKEHRKPIPMYAREINACIPVRNEAIGFDLERCDWVAPHGEGNSADLIIKYTANYDGPQVFAKRLELGFSNSRDGVQAFALDKTSDYSSLYTAPENGFLSVLVDEQARTRKQVLKTSELGRGQYLVFRVRSVTNDEGEIVRANYGKIYGPNLLDPIIEYGRMGDADRLMFTYYLNPTPNDRNLEFDPARNLFKNLKPEERVTDP